MPKTNALEALRYRVDNFELQYGNEKLCPNFVEPIKPQPLQSFFHNWLDKKAMAYYFSPKSCQSYQPPLYVVLHKEELTESAEYAPIHEIGGFGSAVDYVPIRQATRGFTADSTEILGKKVEARHSDKFPLVVSETQYHIGYPRRGLAAEIGIIAYEQEYNWISVVDENYHPLYSKQVETIRIPADIKTQYVQFYIEDREFLAGGMY